MNIDKIKPPAPLSQEAIIRNWKHEKTLLTIVCTTYNQAAFIKSTLHGILGQITEYPFEILCYDDASEDETRKIIEHYASEYPRLFRTIFPLENQYSQGVNIYSTLIEPEINTEYICVCEGDDFWTDSSKLQKQISFLSANLDYSCCTHDVVSIDESDTVVNRNHLPPHYKKNFSQRELKHCWAEVLTQALVFRNVIQHPPEFYKSYVRDVFRASLLGEKGKAAYLDDIGPSAYRLHSGGTFSPLKNSDKLDVQTLSFFWISSYYKRTNDAETAEFFKRRYLEKAFRQLRVKDILKLLVIRFFRANPKKWL